VGIEDSPDTAALIHALAVLVKNLGICMVAEGVETPSQALALQELGCQNGQGYFFAAPMTTSEFEQFLSRSVSIDHAEPGAMAFAARWADLLTPLNEGSPTMPRTLASRASPSFAS
jgi:predicted signal transduction protein with EAL and GGDEF domain